MFEDIKKSQLVEKIRVMAATGLSGEEIKKSLSKEELDLMKSFSSDIEKGGKPAQVGEIREWQGKKMRKQPNGKWVEVSDKGMSRKELELKLHETQSKFYLGVTDREKDMAIEEGKEYDKQLRYYDQRGGDVYKLSDKEYDEAELVGEGKAAQVGEIRVWQGKKMRKQANGKWVEVSDKGMSKEEHSNKINELASKAGEQIGYAFHSKQASKLSDKEYDESELNDEGKDILTDKQKESLSKYTPEQRKLLLVEFGSTAKTPEQFEKLKAIGEYFKELDNKSNNQDKIEEIDFDYSKDKYLVGDATGWRIPSKEQAENMTKNEIMEQLFKISDSQYSAQVRNESLILDELTSLAKFYEALYKYKDSKEKSNQLKVGQKVNWEGNKTETVGGKIEEVDKKKEEIDYNSIKSIKSKINKQLKRSIGPNDADFEWRSSKDELLLTITPPSETFLEEFVRVHFPNSVKKVGATFIVFDLKKLK